MYSDLRFPRQRESIAAVSDARWDGAAPPHCRDGSSVIRGHRELSTTCGRRPGLDEELAHDAHHCHDRRRLLRRRRWTTNTPGALPAGEAGKDWNRRRLRYQQLRRLHRAPGRPEREVLLVFAVQVGGSEITTIEDLGHNGQLHPMQQAFHDNHALQCGSCAPGMIMQAIDLLGDDPDPDEQTVRAGLEATSAAVLATSTSC